MAAKLAFILLCIVVAAINPGALAKQVKCDCDCLYKTCKIHTQVHPGDLNCDANRAKCKKCHTGECNDIGMACVAKSKSRPEMLKCIKEWNRCTDCLCRYESCKTHSPVPEKCSAGLDLCRRCDTEKCDAVNKACLAKAKNESDKRKCVAKWYKCAADSCHDY